MSSGEEKADVSVYVDAASYPYRGMLMCHMIADTPDELHAMAARIGVERRWFQAPPKASFWHYDIAKSKRALAVKAGAIECDRNAFVVHLRRIRESKVFAILPGLAAANGQFGVGGADTRELFHDPSRGKMLHDIHEGPACANGW